MNLSKTGKMSSLALDNSHNLSVKKPSDTVTVEMFTVEC